MPDTYGPDTSPPEAPQIGPVTGSGAFVLENGATINGPLLTGATAATPPLTDNSTSIATTAWVKEQGYGSGGGGGTITGVTAGSNLTGGGTSGNVTVALAASPAITGNFSVAGTTSLNNGALITGPGGGALAPAATTGFISIPTVTGQPTGTPTATSGGGAAPMAYDTANHVLWVYDTTANAWRALTPGGITPPSRQSGKWYVGNMGIHSSTSSIAATTTYFTSVQIFSPCVITAFGTYVSTGVAGANMQIALYPDTGSGSINLAAGPIGRTGDISVAATGLVNGAIANINGYPGVAGTSFQIEPGLWWAAAQFSAASVFTTGAAVSPTPWYAQLAGGTSQAAIQSSTGIPIVGLTMTGTSYGVWPTSGTLNYSNITTPPYLHYQVQ